MSASLDPATLDKIKSLAMTGKKITAIKLYREMTGASLVEAKDAVEAIVQGENRPPIAPTPAMILGSDAALEARVRQLLAAGQKIEAIKIYRERYNCGLKDAKDAVDAIETQMRSGFMPASGGTQPLDTSNIDPFGVESGQSLNLVQIVAAAFLLLAGVAVLIIYLRGM